MSRPAGAPCWDRGVPARTEFCADPDGFQTTWLRSCASRHQKRPNFRAEVSVSNAASGPASRYEAIPTKATLLDDELLALLVQNEIAISLSMDGPKSLTEA